MLHFVAMSAGGQTPALSTARMPARDIGRKVQISTVAGVEKKHAASRHLP